MFVLKSEVGREIVITHFYDSQVIEIDEILIKKRIFFTIGC